MALLLVDHLARHYKEAKTLMDVTSQTFFFYNKFSEMFKYANEASSN